MMRLEAINHRYPSTDFSIEVEPTDFTRGKVYGIIGSNGAGKTTLLNILSGVIETPGFTPFEVMRTSYLQAHLGLFDTTVRRNLEYPLRFRKVPAAERDARVVNISEAFDLESLLDLSVRELSSGQKQRVALARALVYEPDFILLDEPTANIDAARVLDVEHYLLDVVRKRQATVFVVTHSFAQARRMCDEWWVMHDGRRIESGQVSKLIEAPETEPLRRLLELEYR